MTTYYYVFQFDPKENNFYGRVETVSGGTIFEIQDTDHMNELIETDVMVHIDDITGLSAYLKQHELLEQHDRLIFTGMVAAI